MSSSSPSVAARITRATNVIPNSGSESHILQELRAHRRSPSSFIDVHNRYSQSTPCRTSLVSSLCQLLSESDEIHENIIAFILDCLVTHAETLSDLQVKQDFLPFLKHTFLTHEDDSHARVLSTLQILIRLVSNRPALLSSTLTDWLPFIVQFSIRHLSPATYLHYGDVFSDLLSSIVRHIPSLSKEAVDALARSSSIVSSDVLNRITRWIRETDDQRLALFAVHLWECLSFLLSRSFLRARSKTSELFTAIDPAFTATNDAIQTAAFTAWSSLISRVLHSDEFDHQHVDTRLLNCIIRPFLIDSTSASRPASISKCQAWANLLPAFAKHITDVLLPFLSFAFGQHRAVDTEPWWFECRQIGAQSLHGLLSDETRGECAIKAAGDQILNYFFDAMVDELWEMPVDSSPINNPSHWLTSWNAFLKLLMAIFQASNAIDEKQRAAINACLLTRIEHLWIDSRIDTRLLLNLFETFERIGFPLAIETVQRDSSVRTKTLSATQNSYTGGSTYLTCTRWTLAWVDYLESKSSHPRTTLSDQYLHMLLEHAKRLNDEDSTIEEAYLHFISYLIDTLSKTSDENFCLQTCSLLMKCSAELSMQPMEMPSLFWHVWFRCSTHLILILNRSRTFELNNPLDNHKQETSIELLLRPFAFNDIHRLDYSYTLLWVQLFKALSRLAFFNHEQSKQRLIDLLVELLRNKPTFEQAIHDQHNQRVLGFLLIAIRTLLKTFADIDLSTIVDRSNNHRLNLFSNTQKRSLPASILFCLTQLSMIINTILQRLLGSNENAIEYTHVCLCLLKSNKSSSTEQSKALVFTSMRDLIVDLFSLCKIYTHLEVVMNNLTEIIPFLLLYDQATTTAVISSPMSNQKRTIDIVLLNKILAAITSVFEPAHSSSLLQLFSPLFILAFQHGKTIMRNRARKCWNETFGRSTFVVYPNELRTCLRELKDKEYLLLPCFLADQDNSNTIGSGAPPGSTDESQLSQQIEIATPLIPPPLTLAQLQSAASSPASFLASNSPSVRWANGNRNEPIFVPITNNMNYSNQSDSLVVIDKRRSSTSSCLTEKQKEKQRTRHIMPLLCDDNSSTQSNSCTVDARTLQSKLVHDPPETSAVPSLFDQPNSSAAESGDQCDGLPSSENDACETMVEDDIAEESSIARKLRRSSVSAKKFLANKGRRRSMLPVCDSLTSPSPSVVPEPVTCNSEPTKKHPIKGILKRLSPTRPRLDHRRHVIFHDQVKVLVFASPSRRDLVAQARAKSPTRDDTRSPTRMIPKENLPLRKQPMSARRLSAMSTVEAMTPPIPVAHSKRRASKLFHPKDAIVDWTHASDADQSPVSSAEHESSAASDTNTTDCIFPSLIHCDRPVELCADFLSLERCPPHLLDQFRATKIITVGDLAQLNATQLDVYPIPPPKLVTIQRVLSRYHEYLNDASTTRELLTPISIGYEKLIEPSETNMTHPGVPLYDVDTLINSLDRENLDSSNYSMDSPRQRMSITEPMSPPIGTSGDRSPKKPDIPSITLGDRLQAAASIFNSQGSLPFDDAYIELVRQLVNNPSFTPLEHLHLKHVILQPLHSSL